MKHFIHSRETSLGLVHEWSLSNNNFLMAAFTVLTKSKRTSRQEETSKEKEN